MGTTMTDAAEALQSLASITPRWEWRVIEPFPSREIAAIAPRRPCESSLDTYLVSVASVHNAKIRRGTLELKELIDTAEGGFELWRPTLKQKFPTTARELAHVWPVLHVRAPALPRRIESEAQLIRALSPASVAVVPVVKCRRRFDIRGCAGEHALLTIGGQRWETIALEHEDLDQLRAARARLPMHSLTPTNYPAWLKLAAGIGKAPNHSIRVLI